MQDGNQNEPGFVFRPGDKPAESQAPVAPEPSPVEATAPAPIAPEPLPVQPSAPQPVQEGLPHVSWTASEYIANPKSAGWFGLLALASVMLAVIVYFVTRDVISTGVTVVLGVVLGIFAARQPHVLEYSLDNTGLHIGQKFYPYGSFKAFSIATDNAMAYVSLLPLKRFMPPLAIHYDPADEDKITQVLAEYLPYEDHKPDRIEGFTRRIRF